MKRRVKALTMLMFPVGIAGIMVPDGVSADSQALVALDSLQPGLWAIRGRGPDGPAPRQLCLGDPLALLQLRHEGLSCSRFVIINDAKEATVSYSCPGRGNGRTTVKAETSRLAQIESQGIADKTPFQWSLEARRVGECPATTLRRGPKTTPALSFR